MCYVMQFPWMHITYCWVVINWITIKYRFPFPRMDDSIEFLSGLMYIDRKSGYHHIHIREGDEQNTTFKMKEGLYEWVVMPFGLTNIPIMFVRLMNEVLKLFLGKFVIQYLEDILIFSQTREEHLSRILQVPQRLSQEKLFVNLQKCSFMQKEFFYVGFVISQK